VKREHESIDLRARKMMRGGVEPFVVPMVAQAARQTAKIT